MGILAPEIVTYAAWIQWNAARRLTVDMNKLIDKEVSASTSIYYLFTPSAHNRTERNRTESLPTDAAVDYDAQLLRNNGRIRLRH